ncbi:hypothetical protein NXW24_16740 [Bacteroides fragilis]|nr:hypothetical protein [Bacteroides fragilis]
MAQLSSVIGSILRDIVSAQHEANLYSLSLGDSYGKDGKAKDFQLPNVMVSDMELDLKYGVKSASESQQHIIHTFVDRITKNPIIYAKKTYTFIHYLLSAMSCPGSCAEQSS